MREMPGSAEFAPIDPKFSAAFTPTLVGGLLGCCFVVIHDFIRFDAAFGYEIMHILQSIQPSDKRKKFP